MADAQLLRLSGYEYYGHTVATIRGDGLELGLSGYARRVGHHAVAHYHGCQRASARRFIGEVLVTFLTQRRPSHGQFESGRVIQCEIRRLRKLLGTRVWKAVVGEVPMNVIYIAASIGDHACLSLNCLR